MKDNANEQSTGSDGVAHSAGYVFRPMKWELYPIKETRFSDFVTEISIEDEAAGEFVTVKQPMRTDGKVAIDPEEWEPLKNAIEKVWTEIHSHNDKDAHGEAQPRS